MDPTRLKVRALVLLPAATLALLYSCFVPAAYAIGGPPPGRNLIIPAFVLVCAVAYEGAIVGQLADPERRWRKGFKPRSLFPPIAACVLILYLLTTTQAAYAQLRRLPLFVQYASRWDANDSRIRSAQAEGEDRVVIVPQQVDWAGMSNREIGPDPTNWVNECASQYYGIQVTAGSAGSG
jgi:hypothetical protein